MSERHAPAKEGADQKPAGPSRKWVTFRLGQETFALEVMQLREVLRDFELEAAPGSDSRVVGLTNIRGEVVTVLDARVMLGSACAAVESPDPRIMILDTGAERLGLLVDTVLDVVAFADADIEPCPRGQGPTDRTRVAGVIARSDDLIMLIDAAALFRNSGSETGPPIQA